MNRDFSMNAHSANLPAIILGAHAAVVVVTIGIGEVAR